MTDKGIDNDNTAHWDNRRSLMMVLASGITTAAFVLYLRRLSVLCMLCQQQTIMKDALQNNLSMMLWDLAELLLLILNVKD